MKPKVTVIMPMLNAASYLETSLTSVQNQSLQELEILCIDSGSTDGTLEILDRHAASDKRVKIVHAEQKSYGYQLNLGISLAEGDYIGIVEADDSIKPDMYKDLYQQADPLHLDYIRGNVYHHLTFKGELRTKMFNRSLPDGYYNRLLLVKEEPEAMVYANYFNVWDGIYLTSFLRQKNIRLHESPGASYQDAGFAILCAIEAERIMLVDTAYYCYRLDNEGSSVKSQEKYQCSIDEFRWIWQQMQSRGKTAEPYPTLYRCFLWDACNWNLSRLTRHYRDRFLSELPGEFIQNFDESILKYHIPYKDAVLKSCRGDAEYINDLDRRKRNVKKGMDTLKTLLESDTPLVFVTVQNRWASAINTLTFLVPDAVWTVCDNAEHKHGKEFYGKTILSAAEAVTQYPDACYLLPTAKYTEDLILQLQAMGIQQKQMDQTIYLLEDKGFNIDILTNRLHVEVNEP